MLDSRLRGNDDNSQCVIGFLKSSPRVKKEKCASPPDQMTGGGMQPTALSLAL
jgi:hypothetical protein